MDADVRRYRRCSRLPNGTARLLPSSSVSTSIMVSGIISTARSRSVSSYSAVHAVSSMRMASMASWNTLTP